MKVYDFDIRKVLYKKIINTDDFISDPTTVIVNEMDVCFGSARIDVAVINGQIHGYEIKSERDNLLRLNSQIEAYSKVFDTVTIVTCEKHIANITKIIPEWWGIYCVTKQKDNLNLEELRSANVNGNLNIFYLTQLLWKNELIELLNKYNFKRGIKSKSRLTLCKLVVENIEENDIKNFVREKLKSRNSWRAVQLLQLYDGLCL